MQLLNAYSSPVAFTSELLATIASIASSERTLAMLGIFKAVTSRSETAKDCFRSPTFSLVG